MLTALSEHWAPAQAGIWFRGILAPAAFPEMHTEEIIVCECDAETPLQAELKSLGRHSIDQKSGL